MMNFVMSPENWAYLFAVMQLVITGVTALVVMGLTMDFCEKNRQLVKKKAKKLCLIFLKYALIPVVIFSKKYTMKFWLNLKVKDC